MIDLPHSGSYGIVTLMLQRGGQLFDERGVPAFANDITAEDIRAYLEMTLGKQKIAYDCGWGQPLFKAITDGLALFYITPDWRSYNYQTDLPKLAGKMALMPLPAWEKGGRRTSVWGGTGLVITRRTKRPDLAWELAEIPLSRWPRLGRALPRDERHSAVQGRLGFAGIQRAQSLLLGPTRWAPLRSTRSGDTTLLFVPPRQRCAGETERSLYTRDRALQGTWAGRSHGKDSRGAAALRRST
ncbi:MAG: extracellular solute-binding protein [Polyangiaceae bacterium]